MNSIEMIVYDFDGTLVDTRKDIANAVNRVFVELGLSTLPHETISGHIGRGVQYLMSSSLEGTGFKDLPRATDLFMKHYEAHLMENTGFYPNGRETVLAFSKKKQSILSNKPYRFIQQILEHLDCTAPFCSIIGGDNLKHKKPDPIGLLHIMKEFHLEPHQLLMVGDSLVDMEAGQRAGVPTCGVSYGHAGREALEATKPDWVIDDLAELPQLLE